MRACSTRSRGPATSARSWATGGSCRPTPAPSPMPSPPAASRSLGAFVTIALAEPARHADGIAAAVRTATLLAGAGAANPVIVLSDVTAVDETRTRIAGRVGPDAGLSDAQWDAAARGVDAAARAVRDETGLRTVFHHHCATFVETPAEIDALMTRTDPALVGLCLDTGHATFGGGSPSGLLDRYAGRTWHVHFKDCDPGSSPGRGVSRSTISPRSDWVCSASSGRARSISAGFSRCCGSARTPAGLSWSRTCCRRWARRSKARRETGST